MTKRTLQLNGRAPRKSPAGDAGGEVLAISAVSAPIVPVGGSSLEEENVVVWLVEEGTRSNYFLLGQRLAEANKNLYRNGSAGHGLIQILPNGTTRLITKAAQLSPIIVDALPMKVMKEGNVVSELPTASHLSGMLCSEEFLKHLVDGVGGAGVRSARRFQQLEWRNACWF